MVKKKRKKKMIVTDKKKRKTSLNKEARFALVRSMMGQGLSRRSILQALKNAGHKVTLVTLDRDIREVRDGILKELRKNKAPLDEILAQTMNDHRECFQKAWSTYRNSKDHKVQIAALRLVKELLHTRIQIMQSLGIIPKDKADINVYTGENNLSIEENKWEQTNIVNMLMKIEKAEEEFEKKKLKVKA